MASTSAPAEGAGLAESLSMHGSTEKLSSSAVNRILMEFLIYFGRAVFFFYPVYLTGYMGLSISWVLLCLVTITWWKKNRQWKDTRIGTAIEFVDNETHVINKELKSALQMASWVHFPDVEKVHWVNKVLEQAWPFFGMYMEKLLKENIQPAVRLSSPALKMFTFTKVHFGHIPLRIMGIKAYTDEVDQKEVVLDMNICYDGDVDIDAEVQAPIVAGVKGLKFKGMLRVILEPLIGQVPLVGGVTFFFIRPPTLEINWTGMTNLLDSPAFSSLSEETIIDVISSLMVLPNRMCFPLIDQVKVDQMRFPLPRGVVRVHLLEARDLLAKDTYMMGLVKGKSDPYAKLRVGNRHFKSKTVKENLHPKWNEVYEFVVHEAPGQELEVELYDEDTDKDDFLGRYNLDFGEVKREKEMDQWFPLEGVQNGEVHLKLQWFSLMTDSSLLSQSADGLACAMLAVYLDNASNLPKDHKEITEHHKHGKHSKEARLTRKTASPNSFVEFSIGEDVQKSKVAYASKDPVWEEGFTFFVHNVKTQELRVQVKEQEKKTSLGSLNLPLDRLLNTSNMTLDQRFQLERSGANSQIKLKATLRILALEKPPPKIILNPPQAKQQKPQTNQGSNGSVSNPSVATSSSQALSSNNTPATQASSPTWAADSQNGSNNDYLAHRRGSFLASETRQSSPSTSHMRRYDSHSLLSDNSIASSRFDLSEGASYPEAIRKHQGSFGEIHLTVRYANLRNKLIILVNACRNLFPCSDNGTDAYVRLYLLPDQTWRHRKRTQVKRRTTNPVFNDKFEFDVSFEEAQTRKLDVAVKNNKMFLTRERKDIGMVMIDLSAMDLAKGSTEWYELTLPGLKKSS
ncbi:extended synaptotagmin-3-like [Seriola lalandi dorsalis]|uniref:Extended synaptotagmin-3 n=1 Tax=Seriola lalandi dorsalis TaxID=1841481 RepID=A0A3B4YFJ1_SERLL|nr:extended synaptotagmin-3-like [Seriola lalandi dorsalis]XP_056246215.1 extended synaptotagmin-3 [Seriola aureovittata]